MRIIIFVFIFFTLGSFAQKSLEGGLVVGTFYYLGDINTSQQFSSYQLGGGIFLRENLNKRWSIRLGGFVGTLASDDQLSSYVYQKKRNASFQTSVLEIVPQFEFNFLPYKIGGDRESYPISPYFAGGLGFLLATNSISSYNITIPMAVGLKFSLNEKTEIGIEWAFRKTFSDKLDNLTAQEYDLKNMYPNKSRFKQNTFKNDDDWYSFASIFIVYKIFQSGSVCNAYDF
jgi:hypothetical protein